MTKEKQISLTKYLDRLNDKLVSPLSAKRAGNPRTYKQFIQREIDTVKKQLDEAKLEGVKK